MEQTQETLIQAAPEGRVPVIKTASGYSVVIPHPDGSRIVIPVQNSYLGVAVTDDLVSQLNSSGVTEQLLFAQRGGQHNYGRLALRDGLVTVEMDRCYLNAVCPECKGRIIHTSKGYCCEHYHHGSPGGCQWHLPGVLGNRLLLPSEVEDLLNGRPEILDGFRANDNTPYSGILVLNNVHTASVSACVGRCPRCGGRMLVGPNGFHCENYNNPEHPCRTRFFRFYGGLRLRYRHWQQLEQYGATQEPLIGVREDGSLYPLVLKFNEERNLINKFERL